MKTCASVALRRYWDRSVRLRHENRGWSGQARERPGREKTAPLPQRDPV